MEVAWFRCYPLHSYLLYTTITEISPNQARSSTINYLSTPIENGAGDVAPAPFFILNTMIYPIRYQLHSQGNMQADLQSIHRSRCPLSQSSGVQSPDPAPQEYQRPFLRAPRCSCPSQQV